jgi:predicted ATPase
MGSDDAKPASRRKAPQGLYMYGGVGTGKTMLMDLLVTAAPPEFKVPCVF